MPGVSTVSTAGTGTAWTAFAGLSPLCTHRRDQLTEKLTELTKGLSTKVAVVNSTKVAVLAPPKWPWITH